MYRAVEEAGPVVRGPRGGSCHGVGRHRFPQRLRRQRRADRLHLGARLFARRAAALQRVLLSGRPPRADLAAADAQGRLRTRLRAGGRVRADGNLERLLARPPRRLPSYLCQLSAGGRPPRRNRLSPRPYRRRVRGAGQGPARPPPPPSPGGAAPAPSAGPVAGDRLDSPCSIRSSSRSSWPAPMAARSSPTARRWPPPRSASAPVTGRSGRRLRPSNGGSAPSAMPRPAAPAARYCSPGRARSGRRARHAAAARPRRGAAGSARTGARRPTQARRHAADDRRAAPPAVRPDRAEATLALALLAGQHLDEIAAARQVRISTLRFQLRADPRQDRNPRPERPRPPARPPDSVPRRRGAGSDLIGRNPAAERIDPPAGGFGGPGAHPSGRNPLLRRTFRRAGS